MQAHDPKRVLETLPEMEFRELSAFNDGAIGVFWAEGGTSPWERHPDTDELLQVIQGEIVVTVLTDDGPVDTPVPAGSSFVVPRGHWHRQTLHGRVLELYCTPGASEHSTADDPRQA